MRNKKSKMIRNLISYNTKEAIKSPKTGKREKRDTERERGKPAINGRMHTQTINCIFG